MTKNRRVVFTGTSFDTVEDLALTVVNDYKLNKLFIASPEDFQTQCDSWLIGAISNFIECENDLTYDLNTRTFNAELTQLEIKILADLWVIQWFDRQTQDATQVNLKLSTSGGFVTHSESQNLKEKSSYIDKLREKVSQKITEYQLLNPSVYSF